MKKITKKQLEKYLPPGAETVKEVKGILFGIGAAAGYSLLFVWKYLGARNDLFVWKRGVKMLLEDAMMPEFSKILYNTMDGFFIFFGMMVWLMIAHYFSYYKGSKSIYLMKRLPDKWELYRRCMAVPLAALIVGLIVAAVLILIYYGVYLFFTPAQCLVL